MREPNPTARLLYPRKDAAYLLGISVRSLDYLIANKQLHFQKIGKRVLIHRKELERFASTNHYRSVVWVATLGG
jgi:excisionase family DNA binding protein